MLPKTVFCVISNHVSLIFFHRFFTWCACHAKWSVIHHCCSQELRSKDLLKRCLELERGKSDFWIPNYLLTDWVKSLQENLKQGFSSGSHYFTSGIMHVPDRSFTVKPRVELHSWEQLTLISWRKHSWFIFGRNDYNTAIQKFS